MSKDNNEDDNISNASGGSNGSDMSEDSQLGDMTEIDFNDYKTDIPEGQPLNSDFFDLIKQKHDPDMNKLNTAYAIIRRYLIDNKLILTGGMAIDTALRAKGTKLYEIEKIDYDFCTPDFHNDAYKIAQLISYVPQLVSVLVINAMHTSTMRVRFNYSYIADSTYIHKKTYDLVPTLEYMGLRVSHPCFQVLDQHLALSHPYARSPMENVLYKRFRHDITRYELMSKYYDLGDELITISKNKKGCITDESLPVEKKKTHTIDLSKFDNQCLAGYVSYAYWMNQSEPDNYTFSISDKSLKYTTETPMITILSDDFTKLLKRLDLKDVKYYNGLADKLEPRVIGDNIEILDNNGTMTSAHKEGNIYIAGIQHTMLYLGVKATFYKDELAAAAYNNLSKLLLSGIKEKNPKFVYDLATYGSHNRSENDTLLIEKQCGMMSSKKVISSLPSHYYPKETNKFPKFDLDAAVSYNFDGQQVDKLVSYATPEVCDGIIEEPTEEKKGSSSKARKKPKRDKKRSTLKS